MSEETQTNIESTLQETRVFPPPPEFAEKAHIKSFVEYEEIYNRAAENPEKFWAETAENLHWFKKWETILEWNEPFAKWFVGGKINAAYNCLDRHLETDAQRQNRDYLGRRTGRNPNINLSAIARGSFKICERIKIERNPNGATALRCICRSFPNSPSQCSPAPASARRTR